MLVIADHGMVNTSPINSISSIEKNIQSINSDKNNTICIEFTTGGEETLVTTLNSALEKKNISLVGGSVFGYPATATGEVTYNGKSYSNSCAYILIKNKVSCQAQFLIFATLILS